MYPSPIRELFEDDFHNQMTIPVKYYFQDENHPVIFVNTSNHTLAPLITIMICGNGSMFLELKNSNKTWN